MCLTPSGCRKDLQFSAFVQVKPERKNIITWCQRIIRGHLFSRQRVPTDLEHGFLS